jgi:hypothetical protein
MRMKREKKKIIRELEIKTLHKTHTFPITTATTHALLTQSPFFSLDLLLSHEEVSSQILKFPMKFCPKPETTAVHVDPLLVRDCYDALDESVWSVTFFLEVSISVALLEIE